MLFFFCIYYILACVMNAYLYLLTFLSEYRFTGRFKIAYTNCDSRIKETWSSYYIGMYDMTREIGIQVTSAVIATKIQTNGNEYVLSCSLPFRLLSMVYLYIQFAVCVPFNNPILRVTVHTFMEEIVWLNYTTLRCNYIPRTNKKKYIYNMNSQFYFLFFLLFGIFFSFYINYNKYTHKY